MPFFGHHISDGIGAFAELARMDNVENTSNLLDEQEILGYVVNNSRDDFLADRAHTEAREDSAYQRGVEDMRKAGLNPYTIGASPSPSSSSNVGELNVGNKLQILGYLLDLKNLDFKNKELINKTITNVMKVGVSAASLGLGG